MHITIGSSTLHSQWTQKLLYLSDRAKKNVNEPNETIMRYKLNVFVSIALSWGFFSMLFVISVRQMMEMLIRIKVRATFAWFQLDFAILFSLKFNYFSVSFLSSAIRFWKAKFGAENVKIVNWLQDRCISYRKNLRFSIKTHHKWLFEQEKIIKCEKTVPNFASIQLIDPWKTIRNASKWEYWFCWHDFDSSPEQPNKIESHKNCSCEWRALEF